VSNKKVKRIHPAVAVAAIAGIVALIALAELHTHDPLISLKMVGIAAISALTGVKLRRWLT